MNFLLSKNVTFPATEVVTEILVKVDLKADELKFGALVVVATKFGVEYASR